MGFFSNLLGGSTSEDNALAKEGAQNFESISNEQHNMFALDQQALNAVNSAWSPILKGGPFQYGFSTAEDQNLQDLIENQGELGTEHSVAAQQLRQQQLSGGADVLPTGASMATEATARELGAQQTATNLAQEKELGYQTGRENFQNATKATEDVASLSNPVGFADASTSAGGLALSGQKQVDQMNANSLTSKLLGGAISGGVGALLGASPLSGSTAGAIESGFNAGFGGKG